MSETVTFNFNAQPVDSRPIRVPTTTMDTPEGDISAIASGRMQPLPTYSEQDDSHTRPLLSAVDPSDTRHIPPTYTEEADEIAPVVEEPVQSAETPLLAGGKEKDSKSSHSPLNTNGDVTSPSSSDQPQPNSQPGAEHNSWFDNEVNNNDSSTDAAYAAQLQEQEDARARAEVVRGYFEGIKNENIDIINFYLNRGLVTANTVDEDGQTSLLAAVSTKNVSVVQALLDAGAEPDAFGVVEKRFNYYSATYADDRYTYTRRTPLMQACTVGHLPLVKLFHQTYACDDAKIAPDGQIALRLAAASNHREIVDYLPSRRGGGFLRWKTAHEKALGRAKRAIRGMYRFVRFFVWTIPSFVLYTCPKHMIVKPTVKACKYCWANKKRFADYCVGQIKKIPGEAKRAAKACGRGIAKIPHLVGEAGKATWRGIKKIPGATVKAAQWMRKLIVDVAKACWEFLTIDLPKLSKRLGKYIYSLLFVRLPRAVSISAKWLWAGLLTVLTSIWNVLNRLLSAVHTFISSLSIQGFKHVLEAIFVTFPKMLWSWIDSFGAMSWKVLKALFGGLGECVWWIGRVLLWIVEYLPVKIWEVIAAVGQSVGKGGHEILVFFKPKA